MRLATLERKQQTSLVGVTADGRYVDLHHADADLPREMIELLALEGGLARAATALAAAEKDGAFIEGRLRSPIIRPGKIICIGLNYRDHAAESNQPVPSEPVCFSKFSHCAIGPDDAIKLPAVSTQVDYEAELVIVIGRRGKNIKRADARAYVAGYMNGHDVSARDWQVGRPGGQWLLGKTPDTFAPLGPWLVTADEIADPHALPIKLRLNGETMQDSNTREFIFGVDELIAHLSQLITLDPGDIIFTGTPPGVGMARTPPVFMKPGDVAEVEIEGLGVLRNPVEAE